jgi:hypothetical protein
MELQSAACTTAPQPTASERCPTAASVARILDSALLAFRAAIRSSHGNHEPSSSIYEWNTHACSQSERLVELEIHAFLPPMKINVSLPVASHALTRAVAAVFDSVLRIARREISGPAADFVKQTISRALEQAAKVRFGPPMHELGRKKSCISRVFSGPGETESPAYATPDAGTSVAICNDRESRLFNQSRVPLPRPDPIRDSFVPCFLRESICASSSASGDVLHAQCITGPDCRSDGSACLHQGGRGTLVQGFRERVHAAVWMERNVSFKCNLGLSQFGYLYAVARPYSLSALSRTTVVGYEVLRYRLDVEDIEGRNFVVRCPFGHAIANLTAADSATTPLQNALAHCIGSAEFCVVYLPDSVVQLRDIALDVACEPTSFLGSSLLSVMARERERWLSWWTLGGEFMFGLHDMCYGVRTCIGTHASFFASHMFTCDMLGVLRRG